jgi:hypothetical protein
MVTMSRPAAIGTACCLCLQFLAPAHAQTAVSPPAPQPAVATTLLLQVRDQSGPIADATAELLGQPRLRLPALAGLELGGAPLPLRGSSDARGIVRIALPSAAAVGSADGYVHTAAGLGGLVADLQPGRAQRLELQPMGEVTTATGTEPFTLHARARLADGGSCRLPPQTGTRVRLPAGDYELWAHSDDGWIWRRLQVRSGARAELRFEGAPRALPLAPDTRLAPLDWPGLELVGPDAQVLLRGTAAEAALVTRRGDRWLGPHATDTAPPASATRTIAAPDGTRCCVLEHQRSGRWLLREGGLVRGNEVQLAAPPPGDTWLLQCGPDTAPMAAAWSSGELPRLPAGHGVPLRVRAVDRDGARIGHLAVDWTPHGMDPAQLDTDTDERGEATFGPVHAPGRLRVSDPRYLNQQLDLDAVPHDGLELVVATGSTLLGTAMWSDGSPAAGVVVTLRDADGRLRPALRAVASDDRGAFAFAGLPDDRPLVLFASAQREGRTWSGKLDRQRAGGETITLVLRDEDPQLLPAGGR